MPNNNPQGRGGYRQPSNPSSVSGPGALSQRTDSQPQRRLSDAAYGEQQQYQRDQAGAPMASSAPDASHLTPLDAPTRRPDVPVTDGAAAGPGAGPEALTARGQEADMDRMRSYLPVLKHQASLPQASASLRQLVREVAGQPR